MTDRIRILYVDDEADLLELGRMFLEVSGEFSVDTSTSALRSLDSPTLLSYDAVVSDYKMPEMDGIVFLKEIRKRSGMLPFILFTGRGREEVVIEAINNGADFYLQKGGSPEAMFAELAHKVRQAVLRRRSEREIDSLFQATPGAIGVVLNRVMLRVNDYLSTMTGYSREELEGHNTRFLYLNDEDYAAVGRMRDQAYREGKADDVEVRWRKKDGTVIDVRVSAAPVDRSNPRAAMTYCTVDITRMKREHTELLEAYEKLTTTEEELRSQYDELARSERQLRESQEWLRSFMDSAADAFTIWDKDLNLVELNAAALSHLPAGTRKEEVLLKNYRDLFPAADALGEGDRFRKVISTGIPFSGISAVGEGTDNRHWQNVRAFRVGTGLGIASIDITQQKKVEEELTSAYEQLKASETKLREQYDALARSEERSHKSEAEVSGILRAAPVGIGLISTDRVFIRVNDRFCDITGYSREELIGRNARFLYSDEDEYIHAGKFYTLGNKAGTFDTMETRFLRKDGTMRDIRFYGTQIDPANPGAGNIFIVLDITDEKKKCGQGTG